MSSQYERSFSSCKIILISMVFIFSIFTGLIISPAWAAGAVWVGVYLEAERIEDIKKLLLLPKQIIPLALVPVGYPAESKPPQDRYDDSRVRYNRW